MEKKQAKEIFDEFLSLNKDKKLVITTHRKADIDGLASAYAFSTVFPNSIIALKDLDEGATILSEHLSIKIQNLLELDKTQFDGMIVVDTASYTLLAEAKEWNVLLVIDHHHSEGRDMQADRFIIDEESPSTAEIVASLVPVESSDVAFALCAAIVSDTARFKAGSANTFLTLGNLMDKAGATYTEVLKIGEPELRSDVKMAVLKAFQRVSFTYAGNLLIATSEVGSNESDAAQLISEAADIAFVASWKDHEKETRISARARKHVTIPLNEVMKEVGQSNDGAGGGHPKAAGASVKVHTQEALKACVDEVVRRL
jgi:nanoRNase/pAp phosphatase (c-di-AMP/oligoRNAs hydrolase)